MGSNTRKTAKNSPKQVRFSASTKLTRNLKFFEEIHEAAQLLVSCLHSWGLDPDLDDTCISKLGLLKPVKPVSFGLLTFGKLTLIIPGWYSNSPGSLVPEGSVSKDSTSGSSVSGGLVSGSGETMPSDSQLGDKQSFLSRWEFCSALTTQHSLSIVALTNTLMSMTQVSFLPCTENTDNKAGSVHGTEGKAMVAEEPSQRAADPSSMMAAMIRANIKAGWSRLATLYCCLLPDKLCSANYRPPLLHVLARRWQDRCLEVSDQTPIVPSFPHPLVPSFPRSLVPSFPRSLVPSFLSLTNFRISLLEARHSI